MSAAKGDLAPHILHVLPQGLSANIIGAFGTALRHTLVTETGELPDGLRESAYLRPASNFPPLQGLQLPGRMQKLARAMTPYDLVLTHGPQSLDVAMAHTLFKDAMDLPPLIHHEYEPDARGSFRRKWYRRIALGKAAGLVVPGETLEEAALVDWQQPMGRVKRIAPGIDTKVFAKRPRRDGFRLIKHPGEHWVGAWPERSDENGLTMLVRSFAELAADWHLVVAGEDARSGAIQAEIDRLEINDRVHFPGAVKDPARIIGLFDIFVEPSPGSSFPTHIAEAMAAGVPVVAPRSGEAEQVVAQSNVEWLFTAGSESGLAAHLRALSVDKALRAGIGEANRARAVKQFDREKAIATYRRLYSSAMKREF